MPQASSIVLKACKNFGQSFQNRISGPGKIPVDENNAERNPKSPRAVREAAAQPKSSDPNYVKLNQIMIMFCSKTIVKKFIDQSSLKSGGSGGGNRPDTLPGTFSEAVGPPKICQIMTN